MATVVVVNKLKDFPAEIPGVEIVTAKSYLGEQRFIEARGMRVFNLCRSYRYQSTGYYISLLATARGHKIIPDITTIQDTKTQSIIRIKSEELDELIQKTFSEEHQKELMVNIFFGKTRDKSTQLLGQQIYRHFPAPLLSAYFMRRNSKWYLQDIDPVSTKALDENEKSFAVDAAIDFFNTRRPQVKKLAFFPYEMAILINPDEKQPPSNKAAIKKFIKAAETLGIGAWTIERDDYNRLGEYDALFIRETTNVNHYTYRFARRAVVEGLVAIDDPESILKCSNKVYLAELLERHNVPVPRTKVIHKDNADIIEAEFGYPVILKLPDSCFSQGVMKIKNREELETELKKMLDKSDLIIAQEFLPTDFDWRIGIIDRQAIFACKYYMAGGHWQIMNWDKKGDSRYGKDESFDVKDVPEYIIKTALKAANLIGDGFYGVDIKEVNGKPYLVEVNDNPSIDSGIEDKVLKDELYLKIMKVFLKRIQERKGIHK